VSGTGGVIVRAVVLVAVFVTRGVRRVVGGFGNCYGPGGGCLVAVGVFDQVGQHVDAGGGGVEGADHLDGSGEVAVGIIHRRDTVHRVEGLAGRNGRGIGDGQLGGFGVGAGSGRGEHAH